MPTATCAKSSTPLSTLPSVASNNAPTAVQSGPYTKAQFQSTMEGSRTIKSVKEVEQILRDYPAAIELYRTGKYKVKVKYEANVERVILVEKRITKCESNTSTANDNQENEQTNSSNPTNNTEQNKEVEKEQNRPASRSRSQSQDHFASEPKPAPIPTASTNGNNIVHATIPSIRLASNAQPKVDHQRIPSSDREVLTASPRKLPYRNRSASRDSQNKVSNNKQHGDKAAREYPKIMVPFVQQPIQPGNLCQQPRFQQPYFSNPVLQQQQKQQRNSLYMPNPMAPQPNPLFQQPNFYQQRPIAPVVYQQPPNAFPIQSASSMLKPTLRSTNNYSTVTRSISNVMGIPPSIRTFHANQQPMTSFRSFYQPQGPLPMNNQWTNINNLPVGTIINNNNNAHVEQQQQQQQQQRGARNRARSVDVGARNYPLTVPPNVQQQNGVGFVQQYHYHHHHHHRHRPHPVNNNVGPVVDTPKEQLALTKERANAAVSDKLTVRQLNETFCRMDPSGRLGYSLMPAILQPYGITVTDNDLLVAAHELEFNVNEPLSARRLIRILVKLGKITKSNHQQQQQQQHPASPSMLPEDREVIDIMTQRITTNTNVYSSNQLN